MLVGCGGSSGPSAIVFDDTVPPVSVVTTTTVAVATTTGVPATVPASGWQAADTEWQNVTGNLAGMASECGNLTRVAAHPELDLVMAGVALHGLWSLGADGTWTELGQGAGSARIVNRASVFVFDPENPDVFWEAGIYNGGGVYRTDDGGQTFTQLGNAVHSESLGIDMTDPGRSTMLTSTHEQPQIQLSVDGGEHWNDITRALPSIADPGIPVATLVLDAQTFLFATTKVVLRSADGGASWSPVTNSGVTGQPAVLADGSLVWFTADGFIIRSTDQGATWTAIPGGVTGSALLLPDGTVVGLRGSALVQSPDGGQTWKALGPALPFTPDSVTFSPARQTFYASHFDCGNAVLDDAIASLAVTPP